MSKPEVNNCIVDDLTALFTLRQSGIDSVKDINDVLYKLGLHPNTHHIKGVLANDITPYPKAELAHKVANMLMDPRYCYPSSLPSY